MEGIIEQQPFNNNLFSKIFECAPDLVDC
jgi:hypothetical protein